ncbi:hypothetical protein AST00_01155 [Staphylococcus equorum]|uniref:hypothetical protein n=1 Tax=Staphylococcus equorum TaxID=246432 RepID=UPI000852C6D5|nr:hypothetical protein [Staphylococcus equorum]OEK72233.1 hypothetical protein AST00_01155 [Staphylococcus equorum]
MKLLLFFIAILIFSSIWTVITGKYLPSEVVDNNKNNSRYNKRQKKIFIEILARTCVWLVYILVLILIFRLFGFWDTKGNLFMNYPEIIFLAATFILIVVNYLGVRKKYSTGE